MSGAMRRIFAMAAAIGSIFTASVSYADVGTGPYPRDADVLEATNAPALDKIGQDVVRFSSTPALGGRGVIIEIHRRDAKWATGTVTLLIRHPSDHWVTTATLVIEMNTPQFEELARQIDAQLQRKEPPLENAKGEIVVCTDGPGYITAAQPRGQPMAKWLLRRPSQYSHRRTDGAHRYTELRPMVARFHFEGFKASLAERL